MTEITYRAEIVTEWGKRVAKITTETRVNCGYPEHATAARLPITPAMTGADITAWLRKHGFKAKGWARGSHTGIQRTMLTKI